MTDTSTVIACNLTEPVLRNRKEILCSKLSPFLTEANYAAGISRLIFSKPNVTRKMLEDLILLEGECCPFFSFDFSETSSHFQLNVTGPEGSEDMVRDFLSVNTDKACGCAGADKPSSSRAKKHVFGFITLCAVGCAVPPTLAALGFIGAVTGAYIGMWVEVVAVFAILSGGGFIFAQYVKKKQREVSS
ncbi:hypothetical protein AB9F26_21685 [Falsihalocynthiibacter sp. BN13B15]|uniref:hypothetical protein n=1 Tax=Falsihalocynthiibacter sp. BN13B15 TaxID=3240871 RepID=UPI00350EE361